MRVFVTGASGWIGSAVVPELIDAGHQVVGLARSDEAAAVLTAAGADVVAGSIDDLDTLGRAAADSDGVLHLAFRHDAAFSGDFQGAADSDRRAVETFGDALAGSGKPLVIASGTLGLAPGRVATEQDGLDPESESASFDAGPATRLGTGQLTRTFASRDIRSVVVRLSPTVHGAGDYGFVPTLVNIARERGAAGFMDDGSNRWNAVHRNDAARLFRLALEDAPPGSVLHAVAEEGVPLGQVAEVIGRHLDVPVVSVSPDDAFDHFSWLAPMVMLDSPASSARTRQLLGWEPTGPGLIEDLEAGPYFEPVTVSR